MDKSTTGANVAMESGKHWQSYCEDIWGYLDPTSVDSFFKRQAECRYEAVLCGDKLDFDRLATITRAYHWVSPKVQDGDTALFFEVGALTLAEQAAAACANLRLFDQAYKLISTMMEILDADFHTRPSLQFRLWAITIIADCKWQQPDSYRDKLWSPEWMLTEYDKHYERITSILKDNPARDEKGMAVKALRLTAYDLLKVVARYMPNKLPRLISEFNSRWGAALEPQDGHFLTNDPPSNHLHYYWDFEIVKRFITQKLTLEELDFCQERLIQAVKDDSETDQKSLLLSLDLQYRYMAKMFTNVLEFPIG